MLLLKRKSIDATQGALVPLILAYALPLILSTLIQSLFNAVDLAVLGQMASTSAVASVGATSSTTALIVSSFVGLSSGSKIIMARQIGMKDEKALQKTIHTSLLSAVGIGLIVAVAGFFLSPLFMRITSCPAECFDGAVTYLRIYFAAAPAILLYNYGSAVLNASGDTQRPLYYIIYGGVLNAVLNVVLCLLLAQKVAAVAISTAASQVLGAVLVMRRLRKMDGPCRVRHLHHMRFHVKPFLRILQCGLPMCFQQALYPLANLQIQSAVNSFGVAATAGYSAGSTIEAIPSAFNGAFASTTTVFMSQNIGAKKNQRVRQSLWRCLIINFAITTAAGVLTYLLRNVFFGILLGDDLLAVEFGGIRSRYLLLSYGIAAISGVCGHAIQAYGNTAYSAVMSLFGVFVFRTIWMNTVFRAFPTFDVLMLCFPVSWSITMVANIFGCIYYTRRFNRGKFIKLT